MSHHFDDGKEQPTSVSQEVGNTGYLARLGRPCRSRAHVVIASVPSYAASLCSAAPSPSAPGGLAFDPYGFARPVPASGDQGGPSAR